MEIFDICIVIVLCILYTSINGINKVETEDVYNEMFHETPYRAWLGYLVDENTVPNITGEDLKTMIVLVHRGMALGVAADIARYTHGQPKERALFVDEAMQPFFCLVSKYEIHPEYSETVNSVALVFILHFNNDHIWTPISVSKSNDYINTTIIAGLVYKNKTFHTFYQNVSKVDYAYCSGYNIKNHLINISEGVGKSKVDCYVNLKYRFHECKHKGLALIAQENGQYILKGLGIEGPGCSKPTRFINMAAYHPWIMERAAQTRRTHNQRTKLEDFEDLIIPNSRRNSKPNTTENIFGECSERYDLVYRELGKFKMSGTTNTATLQISLYDDLIISHRCASVKVYAPRTSKITFEYGIDEKKMDAFGAIGAMIKTVPYTGHDGKIGPHIIIAADDYFREHNYSILTINFKFHFNDYAEYDVEYYAKLDHLRLDRYYKMIGSHNRHKQKKFRPSGRFLSYPTLKEFFKSDQ